MIYGITSGALLMALSIETIVISILGGIGTGIVGLIGITLQHRYMANTQQITDTLLDIEKLTDRCSEIASTVWNGSGNPASAETAETIGCLHEIGTYVGFVTNRVKNSGITLNSAFLNYRNATTGDDFDVKDRPPNVQRRLEIRSAAASLKIACRDVDFERRSFYLPFG